MIGESKAHSAIILDVLADTLFPSSLLKERFAAQNHQFTGSNVNHRHP